MALQAQEHLQVLDRREAALWALDVEELDAQREELGALQALRAALKAPAQARPAAAAPEAPPAMQLTLMPS